MRYRSPAVFVRDDVLMSGRDADAVPGRFAVRFLQTLDEYGVRAVAWYPDECAATPPGREALVTDAQPVLMLHAAADELTERVCELATRERLDLPRSLLVGCDLVDVAAARAAGLTTVRVFGSQAEIARGSPAEADYAVGRLMDVVPFVERVARVALATARPLQSPR